jgi:HEPN domain-containing protein
LNRYRDWLQQAQADLAHAEKSAAMGDYARACFAAQQAAEMAVKALHMRLGQIAWGHSVATLLAALPEEVRVPPALLEKAKVLDKFYIPTRYPNAHPEGPAFRHYTEGEARQAIAHAREVVEFCERKGMEA